MARSVQTTLRKLSLKINQMAFVFQENNMKSKRVSLMVGNITCEG